MSPAALAPGALAEICVADDYERALHAYGLSGAEVADGMVCFEILTYGVYMAAIAIAGKSR